MKKILAAILLLTPAAGAGPAPARGAVPGSPPVPAGAAAAAVAEAAAPSVAGTVSSTGIALTSTIPVGRNPISASVLPDGREIWVSMGDGTVVVVDAATLAVSGKVSNVGAGCWGLAFAPDGRTAVGTNWLANEVYLLDVARRGILARVEVGLKPAFVEWNAKGDTIYVANHYSSEVSVVDARSGKKRMDIPVSRRPMGIAVSPDGGLCYAASGEAGVVDVVDTLSGRVLRSIPAPVGGTHNLALSKDGRTLYSTGERSLLVIATEGDAPARRIPLGRDPIGVALDPRGRWVFITDYAGGTVDVVDLGAGRKVDQLPAGAGALFPAVSPAGDRLYVANSKGDSLTVYTLP